MFASLGRPLSSPLVENKELDLVKSWNRPGSYVIFLDHSHGQPEEAGYSCGDNTQRKDKLPFGIGSSMGGAIMIPAKWYFPLKLTVSL